MCGIDPNVIAAQAEVQAQENGYVTVALRGALDVHTMGGLWRELEARLRPLKVVTLEVDASDLQLCGSGGLALLRYLKTGGFTPQARVTVRGLTENLDQLLLLFADEDPEPPPPAPPALPEEVGTAVRGYARDLREQVGFLGTMAAELAGRTR